MGIIHKVRYGQHTNPFFLQSKNLKLFDLVEFKTAIIMYNVRKNVLPENIQNFSEDRQGIQFKDYTKPKEAQFSDNQ